MFVYVNKILQGLIAGAIEDKDRQNPTFQNMRVTNRTIADYGD